MGWSESLEGLDSPSVTDKSTISQKYRCPNKLRALCGVSLTCYTKLAMTVISIILKSADKSCVVSAVLPFPGNIFNSNRKNLGN